MYQTVQESLVSEASSYSEILSARALHAARVPEVELARLYEEINPTGKQTFRAAFEEGAKSSQLSPLERSDGIRGGAD